MLVEIHYYSYIVDPQLLFSIKPFLLNLLQFIYLNVSIFILSGKDGDVGHGFLYIN